MPNSNERQLNSVDIEIGEIPESVILEDSKAFAISAGYDPSLIHQGADIEDFSGGGKSNNVDREISELVSVEDAEAFATAVGYDPSLIHQGADIEDFSSRQQEIREITDRKLRIAETNNGKSGALARASVFADAAAK